jgi:hypothetical protein
LHGRAQGRGPGLDGEAQSRRNPGATSTRPGSSCRSCRSARMEPAGQLRRLARLELPATFLLDKTDVLVVIAFFARQCGLQSSYARPATPRRCPRAALSPARPGPAWTAGCEASPPIGPPSQRRGNDSTASAALRPACPPPLRTMSARSPRKAHSRAAGQHADSLDQERDGRADAVGRFVAAVGVHVNDVARLVGVQVARLLARLSGSSRSLRVSSRTRIAC